MDAGSRRIIEGKGKSINILTESREDALGLLEESERNLEMKPTYCEELYKSGAEIHPEVNERELTAGNGELDFFRGIREVRYVADEFITSTQCSYFTL